MSSETEEKKMGPPSVFAQEQEASVLVYNALKGLPKESRRRIVTWVNGILSREEAQK